MIVRLGRCSFAYDLLYKRTSNTLRTNVTQRYQLYYLNINNRFQYFYVDLKEYKQYMYWVVYIWMKGFAHPKPPIPLPQPSTHTHKIIQAGKQKVLVICICFIWVKSKEDAMPNSPVWPCLHNKHIRSYYFRCNICNLHFIIYNHSKHTCIRLVRCGIKATRTFYFLFRSSWACNWRSGTWTV